MEAIDDLKEKLKTEVEQADWDMLRIHQKNKAVILVSGSLSLLDAAVAVALDRSQFVKVWLDNGELSHPTQEQVDYFEKEPFSKICNFIIVQPYVLVQLLD